MVLFRPGGCRVVLSCGDFVSCVKTAAKYCMQMLADAAAVAFNYAMRGRHEGVKTLTPVIWCSSMATQRIETKPQLCYSLPSSLSISHSLFC